MLAQMTYQRTPSAQLALEYLRKHPELVQSWLPPAAAQKFQASLK